MRSIVLMAAIFASAVQAATNPDFFRDIAPLLRKNCAACHAGPNKASDFSVESLQSLIAGGKKHGKAVIGGHPEQSPLIQILRGELSPRMPVGAPAVAKSAIDRLD